MTAWAWIGPSVVGVAAIVFGWLTSRGRTNFDASLAEWQHDAQLTATIRQERREVYVRFLTAVEEAQRLCSAIKDQSSAIAAAKACLDVNYAYPSLLLVGPLALTRAADDITAKFREVGLLISEGAPNRPSLAGVMRSDLLAQMCLTLGYATPEEAAAYDDDELDELADHLRTSEAPE